MTLRFIKTKSIEHSLGVWIPDWRTLSCHIRQKYHSIRTRVHLFSQCSQFIKGLVFSQFLFKPAKHTSTAYGSTLKQPAIRYNMRTQNQLWMRQCPIHTNTHSSGLSSLFLCLTRQIYSGTQRPAGCIQTSSHNFSTYSQSRLECCFFRHFPYYLMAWYN